MKRYIIFGGDNYYPRGGWSDFVKDFENIDEAINYIARRNVLNDWIHIVDIKTGDVVWVKE